MNFSIFLTNPAARKNWEIIPLMILFSLFLLQFIGNLFLSTPELVAIRNVDDLAIQSSIHAMQKAMLAGNWKHVFGCFDYAYGDMFWVLNSVLLLPFYFLANKQFLFIAGREISLLFIFSSIYLIGLIMNKIRSGEYAAKYAILLLLASMPVLVSISVKNHVNPQCIFLGLLSFYLLIKDERLSSKMLFWSAILTGMAIGFKLTSLLITPLIGMTLLFRLYKQSELNLVKHVLIYSLVVLIVAIFCALPLMLVFPFYLNEIKNFYSSLLTFKNMNEIVSADSSFLKSFLGTFSPFVASVPTFFIILFSSLCLVKDDLKNKKYYSLFILGTIIGSILLISLVVNKPPYWLSNYLLSVIILLPIGLLGITTFAIKSWQKNFIIYFIVALELTCGYTAHRKEIGKSYDIIFNEDIKRQILALEEMRNLVPITFPVRILQDINTIFPATAFRDGVEIYSSFGNIRLIKDSGKFDFIALNSKEFHPYSHSENNPMPQFPHYESLDNLEGVELEAGMRQVLRDSGKIFGKNYKLIYNNYDSQIYQLQP